MDETTAPAAPGVTQRATEAENISNVSDYTTPPPEKQEPRFMPYDGDFSDAGNAAKFAALRKADVAFTKGMGWLVWNGKFWEQSEPRARFTVDVFTEDMRKEARSRYLETAAVCKRLETAETKDKDELERARDAAKREKAYFVHAQRSRDGYKIGAALKLSEARLAKPDELFDVDWYLLNTPSGVVDLRDGRTLQHSPLFYQTKITAVSPSNEGMAIWTGHLNRVSCGDREFIEGLQCLFGSSLFGRVFVEGAHFFHGDGANGKTSTSEAMSLGTYSAGFDVDILTDVSRDFQRDVVGLRGARLATAEELAAGRRLSTASFKRLTSTKKIHCKPLYHEPVDFEPSHTAIIATNPLPIVTEFDSGTWRRLFIWPFNAKIPGNADIKNYGKFLFERCGGAILSWAIEGAAMFHKNGYKLKIPRCVEEATANYRRSQVWVSPFLKSGVVDTSDKNGMTRSRELYHAYEQWANASGETVYSERAFAFALRDAGFTDGRDNKSKYWRGISLEEMEVL